MPAIQVMFPKGCTQDTQNPAIKPGSRVKVLSFTFYHLPEY